MPTLNAIYCPETLTWHAVCLVYSNETDAWASRSVQVRQFFPSAVGQSKLRCHVHKLTPPSPCISFDLHSMPKSVAQFTCKPPHHFQDGSLSPHCQQLVCGDLTLKACNLATATVKKAAQLCSAFDCNQPNITRDEIPTPSSALTERHRHVISSWYFNSEHTRMYKLQCKWKDQGTLTGRSRWCLLQGYCSALFYEDSRVFGRFLYIFTRFWKIFKSLEGKKRFHFCFPVFAQFPSCLVISALRGF